MATAVARRGRDDSLGAASQFKTAIPLHPHAAQCPPQVLPASVPNFLLPEGSRLFGTYNSNVSLGQARILVGWSRIVTPEGQSVQLAAFGADDQGRS
ncbi:MAG TPA: hypothetical protein EYP98_19180, partial [Planctomycetes bacterium]|nr:hypothetical protein [Planctomycetota bacterium]